MKESEMEKRYWKSISEIKRIRERIEKKVEVARARLKSLGMLCS